jgi:hypothetical protein
MKLAVEGRQRKLVEAAGVEQRRLSQVTVKPMDSDNTQPLCVIQAYSKLPL